VRLMDPKDMIAPALIVVITLGMWAMVHVWSRHVLTELGYELSAEQSLRERLTGQNRALRIEISTLKSPKRLELIARRDLGLTVPKPEQVMYLWSDE